jgi:hypothetical protein
MPRIADAMRQKRRGASVACEDFVDKVKKCTAIARQNILSVASATVFMRR